MSDGTTGTESTTVGFLPDTKSLPLSGSVTRPTRDGRVCPRLDVEYRKGPKGDSSITNLVLSGTARVTE